MNTVKIDRVCSWCDAVMGSTMVDPLTAALGNKTHGICPECHARHIHGLNVGDVVKVNDLPWAQGEIVDFLEVDGVGACAKIQVDGLAEMICRRFDEIEKASMSKAEA